MVKLKTQIFTTLVHPQYDINVLKALDNALELDPVWAKKLLVSFYKDTTMDAAQYKEYELYLNNFVPQPKITPLPPYREWWETSF